MAGGQPLSVLIVDDDAAIRRIFVEIVSARDSVEVLPAAGAEEALELLKRRTIDIAFVDVMMPQVGGMDLLERVKAERPALEVVMVTAHGTIEGAVQAMKLGAADYLPKPFKLDQVSLILGRLRRVRNLQAENERLRRELQDRYRAESLVGTSPAMQRCHDLIDRVRREDCNVLILGESGTGKELIARAIHYDGRRRDRPFVPIDCGAMQPTLLESELFGHEKGAFTGATARKAGLLETASGGTAFLDEVGDLPLEHQATLLRAIQDKEIRPVGATGYIPLDVRIVAATHQPLEEMVERGRFRRDLYYRLNVVAIRVPPLRSRKDDIPLLVEHFLRAKGQGRAREISPQALHALERYDWPGNVRELVHAVERACTLGKGNRVELEDLPPTILDAVESKSRPGGRSIRDMEVEAIDRLMKEHGGDTAAVAAVLGIDRSTLYRKIKRYGLETR